MVRIVFYLFLLAVAIVLFLWIKAGVSRLTPQQKKQLAAFGFYKALQFIKTKWHILAIVVWRALKGVMKK